MSLWPAVKHFTAVVVAVTCLTGGVPVTRDGPTSLWKISKSDRHIFIGGTVHALSPSDYPLPRQFDHAYAGAAELVFETDRGLTLTRRGLNGLLRRASLRHGESLQQKLKPATWQALKQFMAASGVPVERVARYKPGLLTVMLTMVQKQNLKPAAQGVDAHFLERAFLDQKPVSSFETLFEQMEFFSRLGEDDPDAVVTHALEEASQEQSALDAMVQAWRRGDTAWIEANPIAAMKSYPTVYKAVLADRNTAWIPRIESFFETDAVEFVLVGTFHLAGQDSLLVKLADLGYQIEKQ